MNDFRDPGTALCGLRRVEWVLGIQRLRVNGKRIDLTPSDRLPEHFAQLGVFQWVDDGAAGAC